MGIIRLFNHVMQQRLLQDQTSVQDLTILPVFNAGDSLPIEYQGLAGKGATKTGWEIMSVGSYSPRIGLFKADGTQLAFQNTFTADALTNKYRGTLSLSDAAMTTFVSALTPASDPLTAYLEIKIVDSSGNYVTGYPLTAVFVKKGLITSGTQTVAPEEVPATQSWVNNSKAPIQKPINYIDTWTSPSGYVWGLYIDDNGDWQKIRIS